MSPWAQDTERILSRPLRVHWQGWETTTTRLQQGGWEIAINEDIRTMSMRMTMRHQGHRMYGISNRIDFDFFKYSSMVADLSGVVFEIVHMGTNLIVNLMESQSSFGFKAIDAYPQFTNTARKSIEDFGFFATPLTRTNELIVDPTKIGEILEQIKQAQLPEQEAIRKRERLRASRESLMFEAIPQQQFHAQVVSIAA